MRQPTTKPDSLQPATELAVDLFDNWFDRNPSMRKAHSQCLAEARMVRAAQPHFTRL